jgi:protein-disulfide isomerase
MFLRILYVTIALLAVIAGYKAFVIYKARTDAVNTSPQYATGPEEAGLNVVMFVDYQCPYCKDIYPVIRDAIETDGDARLIIRVLGEAGAESGRLGRLAYAAGLQGRFMAVNDVLLGHYGPFDNSDLEKLAKSEDINIDKLMKDMESDEIKEKMEENISLARKLKIYASPTFMAGQIIYTPTDKLPDERDFLNIFAEARGNPIQNK